MKLFGQSTEHAPNDMTQHTQDANVLRELKFQGDAERTSRAERGIEDTMWSRIRMAYAAVDVEEYFQNNSRKPTMEGLLESIDFSPDEVDQRFLQLCSGVAERFQRNVKDSDSVYSLLVRSGRMRDIPDTPEGLGHLLYEDLARTMPRGKVFCERLHGFFVLYIANDRDYNAVYGEKTGDAQSGGRFHRAEYIVVANREIPLIVRRGERPKESDMSADRIIQHEMQHLINEGLVRIADAEGPDMSLLQRPLHERKDAMTQQKAFREIKDEVLAYLREGRIDDVESILSGELYKHLFHGTAEQNAERYQVLKDVSDALKSITTIIKFHPRLQRALPYAFISVPLQLLPYHIRAFKKLFDRIERALPDPEGIIDGDFADVLLVPVAYQDRFNDFVRNRELARFRRDSLAQVFRGFQGNQAKDTLAEMRHAFAQNLGEAKAAHEGLWMENGSFVPFISVFDGLETDLSLKDEQRTLEDVLDVLSGVAKDSKRVLEICSSQESSFEAGTQVIRLVKSRLTAHGCQVPKVFLVVGEGGFHVDMTYVSPRGDADHVNEVRVIANVSHHLPSETPLSKREQYRVPATRPMDRSAFIEDPEYLQEVPRIGLPPYVAAYDAIDDIQFEIAKLFQHAREKRLTPKDARKYLMDLESWNVKLQIATARLQRDGAHIPEVFLPDYPPDFEGELSDSVYKALCRFRETLFTNALAVPQHQVDTWIDDVGSGGPTLAQKNQISRAVFGDIAGTFSSGKLKDIAICEIMRNSSVLSIIVQFSLQTRHGGFIPAQMRLRVHRREERKVFRRQVATSTDSR